MTPLTTAEIEAGLELAKHPELPPLPWASRARTGGDFAGIITSGSRKAGKQVDICYMARGSGRVEGDFITTAANHYESLAAEVLALRKAIAAMNDARCRHNLDDLLKALDAALSGATP